MKTDVAVACMASLKARFTASAAIAMGKCTTNAPMRSLCNASGRRGAIAEETLVAEDVDPEMLVPQSERTRRGRTRRAIERVLARKGGRSVRLLQPQAHNAYWL